MKSHYVVGWVGLRVKRHGKAARKLTSLGWIRMHHADLNNVNGFDWVRPSILKPQFLETDWRELERLGLDAVAVWYTDAQHGADAPITRSQWRERAFIEQEFNEKWPNGIRP